MGSFTTETVMEGGSFLWPLNGLPVRAGQVEQTSSCLVLCAAVDPGEWT